MDTRWASDLLMNLSLSQTVKLAVHSRILPKQLQKKVFVSLNYKIEQVAFKMFLGITCETILPADKNDQYYSLLFAENPLIDYVELPNHLKDLSFSNIICGAIRGALEAVINLALTYIFRFCLASNASL